jgi:hypothetical protein
MDVTGNPKENDSRWKEQYVCIRDFWEDQSKGKVQRQAGKGRKDKEEKEGKERSEEEDIINSSVHDIKLLYEEMDWASLGTALGYATEIIKGKPGVLEGNDITVNADNDHIGNVLLP